LAIVETKPHTTLSSLATTTTMAASRVLLLRMASRKVSDVPVPPIVSQPHIKLTCRVPRAVPRRNPSAFGSGSPRPGGARERRGGRERRGCAGSGGSKLLGRRCGSTSWTRGRGRMGWQQLRQNHTHLSLISCYYHHNGFLERKLSLFLLHYYFEVGGTPGLWLSFTDRIGVSGAGC